MKTHALWDRPWWGRLRWMLMQAVLLVVLGNLALWQDLMALPEISGPRGWGFLLGFAVFLAALLVSLLAALVWPGLQKVVLVIAWLCVAFATHYMLTYRVVIDASMVLNVWHTDAKEAADVMSIRLLLTVVLLGVAPAIWAWRSAPKGIGWSWRAGLAQVAIALSAALVAAVALWLVFQDFASLMRNHKGIRHQINPLNSFHAVTRAALDAIPRAQAPLQKVGEDAHLGASYQDGQPPLVLMVVVGETARAANFAMGGYARNTQPQMQQLAQTDGGVLWSGDATSCGTNTQASVPCMFSPLGKEAFEATRQPHENLLDVLQRAGLAVVWLDNQSGCKGVCDRVPNWNTREGTDPDLCRDGECWDGIMLKHLNEKVSALDPERLKKGLVVVLHQMGNHGPAYFKRSPENFKPFQPECRELALPSCDRQGLINAYDNALVYTDHVLASAVAWLKDRSPHAALMYMSDHGESLGENNLYLHGLPYAMAPKFQTHVPWITWVSPGLRQRLGLDLACMQRERQRAIHHDNLFHTALGLADVQTEVKRPELDMWSVCSKGLSK